MATIILQAAGAYLGGLIGATATTVGTAAGAVAGYLLDRALLNGATRIEGPRLASAPPLTAEDGSPAARAVLLKGFGPDGFVFFTNYQSKKRPRSECHAKPYFRRDNRCFLRSQDFLVTRHFRFGTRG